MNIFRPFLGLLVQFQLYLAVSGGDPGVSRHLRSASHRPQVQRNTAEEELQQPVAVSDRRRGSRKLQKRHNPP